MHSCEITTASICLVLYKFTNSISHLLPHLSFAMTTNNTADHTFMQMRLSNEVKQLAQDNKTIIKWQHQDMNGMGLFWQLLTQVLLPCRQATWMPGSALVGDGVRLGMLLAARCPPTFQALPWLIPRCWPLESSGEVGVMCGGNRFRGNPALPLGEVIWGRGGSSGWIECTLVGRL